MIADWRKRFGQGDFPFLFVQLAPYRYDGQRIRSACPSCGKPRLKTLSLAQHRHVRDHRHHRPSNDIHPPNKQDVGRRLALWALANTYGKTTWSTPARSTTR